MDKGDVSKVRVLDPVVVEALKSITRRVYQRRRPELWHRFRRYYSMLDIESRDSTIAAFEHLRNSGYDFPPFLVRRWANANGWKKMDAQLLDDYAAGVLARVKYHHPPHGSSRHRDLASRRVRERALGGSGSGRTRDSLHAP